MSLMKCPECGKEISDRAEKCPYCGAPNPNFDPDIPNPGELYTPCARHPERKSVQQCSVCGKTMCSLCTLESVTLDGTVYCPECYLAFLKERNKKGKSTIIFSYIALVIFVPFFALGIVSFILEIQRYGFWDGFLVFGFIMGFSALLTELPAMWSSAREQFEEDTSTTYGAVKKAIEDSKPGASFGNFIGNSIGTFIAMLLFAPIYAIVGAINRISRIISIKRDIRNSYPEIEKYEQIVAGHAPSKEAAS